MKNIVLSRIDDRLIHGQILSGWVPYTGANVILIIDNEAAGNKLAKRVLEASSKRNLGIFVVTEEKALRILQEEPRDKKEKMMLLVKSPAVFLHLIESGCNINAINLGGMGLYDDRKPLFRNISCTKEELCAMKKLRKYGVTIYYQLVPEQKRFDAVEVFHD